MKLAFWSFLNISAVIIISSVVFVTGTACANTSQNELLSPDGFLDVEIGDPFHLTYYSDIVRYMQYVSDNSERVETATYGTSTLGRPLQLVIVSSAENISNLDSLLELNHRLADPRDFTPEELEGKLDEAKLFLWVECNIHSTEPAGAEIALEIVYELATTDDPQTLGILDDIVLVIIPSTEPDGHEDFTEWFHTYKDTGLVRTNPPIYGAYVGHDNNRDRFNQALKELKAWAELWLRIKPVISVDVHQSIAPYVFFVPPGKEPTHPEISPLIEASWKMIGGQIMAKMYAAEMPGVTSNVVFDMWYPGYGDTWASLHHSVGLTFEIWTGFISGPTDYEGWSIYAEPEDLRYAERDSNTPWPWPGGWWTLRDQIDYGKKGLYVLLNMASERRFFFLKNRYSMTEAQIKRGLSEAPFGWVIPSDQVDSAAVKILIEKLVQNGIEVRRIHEAFSTQYRTAPAGSFLVLMSQPYGNFAKALLEIQHYPESMWPYDVTAWTLPLMIGAEAIRIDDPSILDVYSTEVTEVPFPNESGFFGSDEDTGVLLLNRTSSYTPRAINVLSDANAEILILAEAFDFEATTALKGDFIIQGYEATDLESLARELGLRFYRVNSYELSQVNTELFEMPRIALYHAWLDLREEGWTRLVLEDSLFEFSRLNNAALLEEDLINNYDVIIMPDVRKWAAVSGYTPGTYPEPYAGGIGDEGISRLREFVANGGRLITIGRINDIVFEDFDAGLQPVETTASFHVPGSLLKIEVSPGYFETRHYSEKPWAVAMFRHGYTAFEVLDERVSVISEFGIDCLVSGWAEGTPQIEGKAAVVIAPYGEGEIVGFGFDPTYRYQSLNTLPLFFDSVLGAGRSR